MKVDLYTKGILTIIAACLVWLIAGGNGMIPAVEAQDRTPTRVILVGWEDGDEFVRRLPGVPESLRKNRGLPLPVQQQ